MLSELDPENPLANFTRFYPINGFADQYMEEPVRVVRNETARFYVIGIGGVIQSPFHIHSTLFKVRPSGILWNVPHYAQTHLIANGDTAIMEAKWEEPGRYLFHVHGIQEERGSMAILDVLEDDLDLKATERPSNMPGSKSMIEWQEGLVKNLEKPMLIEYEDLDSASSPPPLDHSSHGGGKVPAVEADTVAIAKGSVSPEIKEPYIPPAVRASSGATITWANEDNAIHTVTETNNKFDSGLLQAGAEWQYTFTEVGQFDYYCLLHPWMKGSVVVEE